MVMRGPSDTCIRGRARSPGKGTDSNVEYGPASEKASGRYGVRAHQVEER